MKRYPTTFKRDHAGNPTGLDWSVHRPPSEDEPDEDDPESGPEDGR